MTGSGPDLDELGELEEQRRFLLRSLEEIEREHASGDLDERAYTALRDDYTHRAAEVIRAIEGHESALPRRRPVRRGRLLAAVAVVCGLAAAAGVLVAQGSGTRLADQPSSGDIRRGTSGLLAEARAAIGEGRADEAIRRYDEVLATDPDNPEALAYRGWLLVLTGDARLVERGEALIDRAVAADETYPDAHALRGLVLRQRGDAAGALAEFDRFLALDPPPDLEALVRPAADRLRADLAGGAAPTAPSAPTATSGTVPQR